jgi:phytoene dehydrogenase-like protein
LPDVVVIGAGHNGLVAAGYLARAGHDVTVVEAARRVGGMTSSATLIPEAPNHVVHPCAVDMIMIRGTTILRDLELRRHGLRTFDLDPAYAYLHHDGTALVLWRDAEQTAREIARFSPADSRAYLEFVRVLEGLLAVALPMMRTNPLRPAPREVARAVRGLAQHRRRLADIGALAAASAEQVVAERFEHPVVASAVLNLAAGAGPTNAEGSGLSFLLLGLLHVVGISRSVGGMQGFADALATSVQASGGTILTEAPVEEILVSGGRATGVRLGDGREIHARTVLATCDPHTALRTLLPEGVLDRRTAARIDHVPMNAAGASPLKIDVAVGERLSLPHHSHPDADLRNCVLLYGTADEVSESFGAARRGVFRTPPVMWVAITSAPDRTLAPEGQDVVYLYPLIAPIEPPKGWDDLLPEAERATLERAGEFLGGLDAELGRWVETPDDMARRTGARNASITHVDFGLMRSGPLRPAAGLGNYRTPLAGLLIGGAGSHPGGGVTGLPGRIAADEVRRELAGG